MILSEFTGIAWWEENHMAMPLDPSRFERFETYSSSMGRSGKIRNWKDWSGPKKKAEFLSKLWAHFGSPEITYEGFYYFFRDKVTGLYFSVSSGASGPSFGGNWEYRDMLEPMFIAIEDLLDSTTPVDGEIEFDTDFGIYRIGARNEIPFEEEVTKKE